MLYVCDTCVSVYTCVLYRSYIYIYVAGTFGYYVAVVFWSFKWSWAWSWGYNVRWLRLNHVMCWEALQVAALEQEAGATSFSFHLSPYPSEKRFRWPWPHLPSRKGKGVWLHTLVLLDWQGEGGLDLSSLARRRGEAKVKVVMPHPFHCLGKEGQVAMLTKRRRWTWPLLSGRKQG